MPLQGLVTTGKGEGAAWTALPWFRAALAEHFGLDPVAGTFNLTLAGPPAELEHALLTAGTVLVPPQAAVCCSLLLPVRLLTPRTASALLVRPLVPGYDPAQVELVAADHLRRSLGLTDGDAVVFAPGPGRHGWIQGR